MSRMVNMVFYGGRLGHSPKVRDVAGKKVATFSLANTEKWTKDGQPQERTVWADVECWGKTAELVEKYVAKGDSLQVVGKWAVSKWEKDGVRHQRAFINAREVFFGQKAKPKDGQPAQPEQAKPVGWDAQSGDEGAPNPQPDEMDGSPLPDEGDPMFGGQT